MSERALLKKSKQTWSRLLIVAAAIFLAGAAVSLTVTAADKESEGDAIMASCGQCHEEVVKSFSANPHHKLGTSCTDCHGNSQKHMEEGGAVNTIVTFTAKGTHNPLQNSKQCLQCHKASVGRYMSGPHGKASLDCTQCHTVHAAGANQALLKGHADKLCASCHQDVASEFMLNEKHRLQEGILQCTSCHDVHEPASRVRLGGFKDESCLKCHTEKGGPFIHEHEAARIEGCVVCHEVHGSPNRHLLKHQNAADLCISCHTVTPSWHKYFSYGDTNCVSCHSAIHGSNLDKLFLK